MAIDQEKLRDLLRMTRAMKDALRYIEETIFDELHPHERSETISEWEENFNGDRILDLPQKESSTSAKVAHD
jgi:hypothetical protein